MMRWEARVALLMLVALACIAPPLLAATSAKAPPRLSAEQATRRARAIAKAFEVPVDKAAVARFSGSTWTLGTGFPRVVIRDDTGQLLELYRPREAPPPGAKPFTRVQATAIAARVLKVAGTPADAGLGEPEQLWGRWWFHCRRQSPQGVPYDDGRTAIVIDDAGHVEQVRLYWSSLPRISAGQAKEKAAAFAKAAGLPWDDTATPTLECTGDPRDQTGPTRWNVRGRDAGVVLRGDTGAVLGFGRGDATGPDSGVKPVTEEEAVAAATRVLRVVGAAPGGEPQQASASARGWNLAWERHTPDGIPYETDSITATVDATGRVVSASFDWHSRPPESTKAKLPEKQAMRLALDWARQSGWLDTGHHRATAGLRVIRPSDFGRAFTQDYDVPTRLTWAVSIVPTEGGSSQIIAVDAADGEILGRNSGDWVPPPKPRTLAPRAQLAFWVAIGPLVAGIAAVVAYLARRREGKPVEEQEG
jgi:hypothetical protein